MSKMGKKTTNKKMSKTPRRRSNRKLYRTEKLGAILYASEEESDIFVPRREREGSPFPTPKPCNVDTPFVNRLSSPNLEDGSDIHLLNMIYEYYKNNVERRMQNEEELEGEEAETQNYEIVLQKEAEKVKKTGRDFIKARSRFRNKRKGHS